MENNEDRLISGSEQGEDVGVAREGLTENREVTIQADSSGGTGKRKRGSKRNKGVPDVKEVQENGIRISVENHNLIYTIKKNQIAVAKEDARPSRFTKGDKIDVMIVELDISKRKVSLSIKALEEAQSREAVKKYGSKDSGASLGEILGPVLKKKNK